MTCLKKRAFVKRTKNILKNRFLLPEGRDDCEQAHRHRCRRPSIDLQAELAKRRLTWLIGTFLVKLETLRLLPRLEAGRQASVVKTYPSRE